MFYWEQNTVAKSGRQGDMLCGYQQKLLPHKMIDYDTKSRGCTDLTQSITHQSDLVIGTVGCPSVKNIYTCIF